MIRHRGSTPKRARVVAIAAVASLITVFIGTATPAATGKTARRAKPASHKVASVGSLNSGKGRYVDLRKIPQATGRETQRKVPATRRKDGTNSDTWKGKSGPTVAKPKYPKSLTPPNVVLRNWAGVQQSNASCACQPPDVNMAAGASHLIETTNLTMAVYSKANPPALQSNVALATFLGTSNPLSDPRIMWDSTQQRFALVVIDTNGPGMWMAFSKTPSPFNGWWIYHFTIPGIPAGGIADYPEIGQTQDAWTVTSNNFSSTAYINSTAFSVPKSHAYYGLQWGSSLFGVNYDTAPTQVAGIPIDNSTNIAYFVSPDDANNVIKVYALANPGYGNASLSLVGNAPYSWGAPPRRVNQPGTTSTLDPLDGRFVWAPMVLGTNIWFAHGVAIGSFPGVNYGFVKTDASAVTVSTAFHSGTSDDFNPSIGVYPSAGAQYVFLNWAYTDSAASKPTSAASSGLSPPDAVQHLSGNTIFTGSVTGQDRFGDYSSVSITPFNSGACPAGQTAFIGQQVFNADGTWATRLSDIGFC